MKLEQKDIIAENFGTCLYEDSFKVGDIGLVLGILRDKLYSNPIRAICREITCNARDANREVGLHIKPISIQLPTKFDPHLKIKDSGPGISPNRISEIFIQYGKSTKRNDNIQTGAFGIGAKTPFAYSDQFHIITTSNDDGKNVKRTYIAYIDESETGKIRLVSELPTDEKTGTEISIKIQQKDFSSFQNELAYVCNFWEQRPTIINHIELPYKNTEYLFKTNLWAIQKQATGSSWNYYTYDSKLLAIIDGIQYPIHINDYITTNSPLNFSTRQNVFLYFNTGELSLSANREELQYDEKTNQKLAERINLLKRELTTNLEKEIHSKPNFGEAVSFVVEFNKTLGLSVSPKWNGITIPFDGWFSLFENYVKQKYTAYRDYSTNNGSFVITSVDKSKDRTKYKQISPIDKVNFNKSLIIINDLSTKLSRERLQKCHNTNICVISFDECEQDNQKRISKIKDFFINAFGFDIDLTSYKLISSIEIDSKSYGKNNRKAVSVFEFDMQYKAAISKHNYWRPVEDPDFTNNICVFYDRVRNKASDIVTNDELSIEHLDKIKRTTNVKIYAVKEATEEMVSVVDFLKSTLEKQFNISIQEMIDNFEYEDHYSVFKDFCDERNDKAFKELSNLIDDSSPMFSYLKESSEKLELREKLKSSLFLNYLQITNQNISQNKDKGKFFYQRYPLLETIHIHWSGIKHVPAIAQYIRLVDSHVEQTEIEQKAS